MNLSEFDYLDLGSSNGGSMDFARNKLGGRRGLGIDLDARKVARARELGLDCIEGDITRLDLPADSVRFVIMSHILEHLPGLSDVLRVLRGSMEVATDFLYILGPWFDADDYLAGFDLKPYWSDWRGHTCHLRMSDLDTLLRGLGFEEHVFLGRDRVADSGDPAIHPRQSPPDQHDYDAGCHPPKSEVTFDRPVYREMICCVPLRPLEDWEAILRARPRAEPIVSRRAPQE